MPCLISQSAAEAWTNGDVCAWLEEVHLGLSLSLFFFVLPNVSLILYIDLLLLKKSLLADAQHGFGEHCSSFRQHGIDGHAFAGLVDRDLERLGVNVTILVRNLTANAQNSRDRRTILDGIAQLSVHVEVCHAESPHFLYDLCHTASFIYRSYSNPSTVFSVMLT